MKLRCEISDNRVDENSFVVAITPVPDFPDDKPRHSIVRSPLLAVIGANDEGGQWSFVLLDADEKHCIGDKLLELGIPTDKWVWCNLFN